MVLYIYPPHTCQIFDILNFFKDFQPPKKKGACVGGVFFFLFSHNTIYYVGFRDIVTYPKCFLDFVKFRWCPQVLERRE